MKTEKEKMLSGENYIALDKELVQDRIKAKKLLHKSTLPNIGSIKIRVNLLLNCFPIQSM